MDFCGRCCTEPVISPPFIFLRLFNHSPSFISSSFFLRCIKLSEEVERNCCFPASTIPILNQVKNLFYSYLAYIISKIDAADFFLQYKFLITTFGSLEELGLESSAKITEITPPPIHDLSPSHYREPRSLSLSRSPLSNPLEIDPKTR